MRWTDTSRYRKPVSPSARPRAIALNPWDWPRWAWPLFPVVWWLLLPIVVLTPAVRRLIRRVRRRN